LLSNLTENDHVIATLIIYLTQNANVLSATVNAHLYSADLNKRLTFYIQAHNLHKRLFTSNEYNKRSITVLRQTTYNESGVQNGRTELN